MTYYCRYDMAATERTKVFQARISEEELIMLGTLADEDKISSSDVVRRLVRGEFERRFGDKRPTKLVRLRALVDHAAEQSKRQDIRAQIDAVQRRRKDFDRKGLASAAIIAAEERAYDVVVALEDSASKTAAEKALVALEELEAAYVNAK